MLAVAAMIAVKNWHGPLIPMARVGLVGLGAILGKLLVVNAQHKKRFAADRNQRVSHPLTSTLD
jgi:hypothetical protein